MYITLNASWLPKKEREYLKKRKVEKKLNKMIESGAKCGYLRIKAHRYITPYQIGRDIEESLAGKLKFEFYRREKRKVVYKWNLPGYEDAENGGPQSGGGFEKN